jgi:NADH:ubiquinone oxidoreductase subunit 5 (subunit L)/multisubunit Na+/H+ antiporter MnhA subunit
MTGLTTPGHWLAIDWMLAVALGWMLLGLVGVLAMRRLAFVARVLFPLGGLLGLALAGVAMAALLGTPEVAVLPIGLPSLPFHLRLDSMAAFFLLVIGAASAGISAFAAGYFRQGEGTPPGLLCLEYHVFLVAMVGVVLADDAYAFMVMWETMALSSYFLVTANHRIPRCAARATCTSPWRVWAPSPSCCVLACCRPAPATTPSATCGCRIAVALLGFGGFLAGGVRLWRQGRHPAAARVAA